MKVGYDRIVREEQNGKVTTWEGVEPERVAESLKKVPVMVGKDIDGLECEFFMDSLKMVYPMPCSGRDVANHEYNYEMLIITARGGSKFYHSKSINGVKKEVTMENYKELGFDCFDGTDISCRGVTLSLRRYNHSLSLPVEPE